MVNNPNETTAEKLDAPRPAGRRVSAFLPSLTQAWQDNHAANDGNDEEEEEAEEITAVTFDQVKKLFPDPEALATVFAFFQRIKELENQLAGSIRKHNRRCDMIDKLRQQLEESKDRIDRLRRDEQEFTTNFQQQLDDLRIARDAEAAEAEALATHNARLKAANEAYRAGQFPEGTPTHTKHTAKIPDPKTFTGFDDKKDIEQWANAVRRKLFNEGAGFPTEQHKINYVVSLLEGKAADQAENRIEEGSAIQYSTAEDVLQHMIGIFKNPDKVRKARNDVKVCYMRATETFQEYYGRFQQLYTRSKMPEDILIDELWDKLSIDLQTATSTKYIEKPSIEDFVDYCTKVDNTLRTIGNRKNKSDRFTNKATTPRTPTNTAGARATTPMANRSTPVTPSPGTSTPLAQPYYRDATGRPRYADPNKQLLSSTGACFKCKELGHLAKDCPTRLVVLEDDEAVAAAAAEKGKDPA